MTKKRYPYLDLLKDKKYFNRVELHEAMNLVKGSEIKEAAFKARLQRLLVNGKIMRVGRNAYKVLEDDLRQYTPTYSSLAEEISIIVDYSFPNADYRIEELKQLNEFVPQPYPKNIIFLAIQEEMAPFIFGLCRKYYPGRVFLNPNLKTFKAIDQEEVIVIRKIVTETPRGIEKKWYSRMEVLLVDLVANPIWFHYVDPREIKNIYEAAFDTYIIDESTMFRYAKRRGVYNKIKEFIDDYTDIELNVK
ncbi:MAG: hypothetical protein HUJ56_04235 [Erysipelotrichaceae bacterium]|nr:hypothetical protein [Erysipelotrichaceae bacterium]